MSQAELKIDLGILGRHIWSWPVIHEEANGSQGRGQGSARGSKQTPAPDTVPAVSAMYSAASLSTFERNMMQAYTHKSRDLFLAQVRTVCFYCRVNIRYYRDVG